jgi:hypothetical protein
MRFAPYPTTARVVNADGATVLDSDLHYVSGFIVMAFDTVNSVYSGPVSLDLSTLEEAWDSRSASWAFAVDTVADQRPWTDPGAGPATPAATAVWDPAFADSVVFALDSMEVARWADSADPTRGARVDVTTDGVQLKLNRVYMRLSIRPGLDPDTLVTDTVRLTEGTVVYDPPPSTPLEPRVGGAPAWRTVMGIMVPLLTGPPELCAAVGCPYAPESGNISYAALVLTSQATEAAFEPVDTVRIDVRSVLSPATLPKSPLGPSQTGGLGTLLEPELFGVSAGSEVEIPITAFMRTLLGGPGASGLAPPSTLALTSVAEPLSLAFASFAGPTDPGAPVLRLVLTVGTPQALP